MTHLTRVAAALALAVGLTGCGLGGGSARPGAPGASAGRGGGAQSAHSAGLPGMPPVLDPGNVYSETAAGRLSPAVAGDLARIYVPDTESNTVDVIDPATFQVVDHFPVGALPQHVTPSYDLSTLWVDNDRGNSLTPVDPRTGRAGVPVPVVDPYNLYFTPDGAHAIVVAEARHRLDFRDPHTMALQTTVPVTCAGVDHMDFTADGRFALASCEFSGQMLELDVAAEKVVGTVQVGGMPQDVKLSPDGSVFYVADMRAGGLHVIDAHTFAKIGFIPTGRGAHGLYPSRDAKLLYVSNRDEGTVSVLDFATRTLTARWVLAGGHASPDMGGVSADGGTLWLSGRYNNVVYAIDTATGALRAPPIPVGRGPHGLCVFPQPGRYSLGHTGVLR